jgi:hypothetical protein
MQPGIHTGVDGNRQMSRRIALSTVLLLGMGTGALAQEAPYPPVVTFAVVRNGENIGKHVITFQQKGDSRIVTVNADITVKAMGVAAYHYVHRSNEVWVGDQLQSLQATTEDNGRKFSVSAQRAGANLKVEHTSTGPVASAAYDGFQAPDVSRETLPASTMPTSLWNFRYAKQSTLLNTQYGIPSRVTIVQGPKELVKTAKGSVEATRYTYSGDLHMELWYDARDRWVRGTFAAIDGSKVEYILQE